MANWTDPRTWTVGELVTKSIMDVFIRDNQNFLYEQLSANILDVRNANIPLSGFTAASLEQVETSAAETYKPSYHQLRFDASTDEARMWAFRSWFDTDGITGMKVNYSMDTDNTSASVVLRVNIAAISDGDSSITAKSFDTDNDTTVSVPDSENELDTATLTISNWDSVASGDEVIVMVTRVGTSSDDDATGDFLLRRLWFYK